MSEHIVYPRVYVVIFLALLLGTGVTAGVAFFDFPGPLNAVVALTIAFEYGFFRPVEALLTRHMRRAE